MAVAKKQEQNEVHKDQDAKDVEISQLKARIAQLEQENLRQRDLLIQLNNILGRANILAADLISDATEGDKIVAGLKLAELGNVIKSNFIALNEIVKGWEQK